MTALKTVSRWQPILWQDQFTSDGCSWAGHWRLLLSVRIKHTGERCASVELTSIAATTATATTVAATAKSAAATTAVPNHLGQAGVNLLLSLLKDIHEVASLLGV